MSVLHCPSLLIFNVMGNDTVVPVPVLQTYQSTTTTSTTTTSESLSVVFKGCTFVGCSISMSGQATSENKYENGVCWGEEGSQFRGLNNQQEKFSMVKN